MKKLTLLMLALALWSGIAAAAETRYTMRVDGLACPYCAYGIEKKLKQVDGVKAIDIDLNAGVVRVTVAEGVTLTEERMRELFNDAGFTYRSMQAQTL